MSFGRWSLGIGDPTWIGWVITVSYFLAAVLSFAAFRRARSASPSTSPSTAPVWLVLTIFLSALGFNKQLDLQILFTEIGRLVAFRYGWYDQRREVQFIMVVILIALLTGAVAILLKIYHRLPKLGLSLLGCALLMFFIVHRAATFQHFPIAPNWDWLNALLELSGAACIAAGTYGCF